jgi:anti-sigma regulatory factor (Ser/Thr protein kinase)
MTKERNLKGGEGNGYAYPDQRVCRAHRVSDVPAIPAAVPSARALTHGLADHQRDAAALVVTELVTNAVTHADTEIVTVEVTTTGDGLRVAVTDDDPAHMPTRGDPADLDQHGRGLLIVDCMCIDLHCETGAGCKTIVAIVGVGPDAD